MDYLLDEQVVEKEVKYGGLGIRLLAHIIDGLFLIILNKIIGIFIDSPLISIPISLFSGLAYYILLETSEKQGTLGKMLLNLKVCNIQYEKIRLGTSILRYIIKKSPGLIFLAGILISGMESVLDLINSNNFFELYNMLGSVFFMLLIWFVASLVILFSITLHPKKQGIHDLIAKTYVIQNY